MKSDTKPSEPETALGVRRGSTKISALALSNVLLLVLAVGSVIADSRATPEGEIDRPSQRAIPAFVPRLGKRLDASVESQRIAALGRVLCENSQDCGKLALLGALVRDIAIQEAASPLMAALGRASDAQSEGETSEELLRRLVAQQDQLMARRDTRASLDGGASASSGSFGGAKRVAFTPRIGR